MISLVNILKEAVGAPKAIILAGAPGAPANIIAFGVSVASFNNCTNDIIN